MADRTLAFLRKAFNWWATRDDEFTSPIIKGMARSNSTERRRTRILDDEEIRDVWTALDNVTTPSCFASFIRLLLLTGQRRTSVSHAHADELKGDTWTIPAARSKTKTPIVVPLSAEAKALLATRRDGYLMSTEGGTTGFSGYGLPKIELDREIDKLRKRDGRKPMPHFVLHDLRRTARSIMSRYATPDVAERVIGHAIPGMRGVYDHHQYADEKRLALQALADHVMRIVKPAKVVAFPKRKTA
jgi:integrase